MTGEVRLSMDLLGVFLQETMITRLVVAEVIAMFAVLRVGGDFVCKTFELTTPTMLQICWTLHHCFGRFAIVKPIVGADVLVCSCIKLAKTYSRVDLVYKRPAVLRVQSDTLLHVVYEQVAA